MHLKTNKGNVFYLITSLFLVTGWLWFLWATPGNGHEDVTICFFKNVTGQPCPACGSTTSLQMLAAGDWQGAMMKNPLGYIAGAALILLPLWIIYDVITKRKTLYKSLLAFDEKIRKHPLLLIPILLPIILNWIWNIMKM